MKDPLGNIVISVRSTVLASESPYFLPCHAPDIRLGGSRIPSTLLRRRKRREKVVHSADHTVAKKQRTPIGVLYFFVLS